MNRGQNMIETLREGMRSLREENAALTSQVDALTARIAELETKIAENNVESAKHSLAQHNRIAELETGLANMLVMLDRARTQPGDIFEKRLNAEHHARGAIIRLLNLVQLPNEDTEDYWPRYNKTLERLQKGGEG